MIDLAFKNKKKLKIILTYVPGRKSQSKQYHQTVKWIKQEIYKYNPDTNKRLILMGDLNEVPNLSLDQMDISNMKTYKKKVKPEGMLTNFLSENLIDTFCLINEKEVMKISMNPSKMKFTWYDYSHNFHARLNQIWVSEEIVDGIRDLGIQSIRNYIKTDHNVYMILLDR